MKRIGTLVPEFIMASKGRQNVSNVQKLNAQAIGAVYDQYFSEVYRFVLYRVGDQTLAEDISSDVFIRLLEAIHAGRGPDSNIKGWLIGTASHVIADHMRKRYRRPENELHESIPDLKPGPVSEVDAREEQRLLKDAYSQLTDEQQNVLALRFGQGYSLEETAEVMKKNVNAIKALQFRALNSIQRKIGKVDYE